MAVGTAAGWAMAGKIAAGAATAYSGYTATQTPDAPDVPDAPAQVSKGDEGVRQGELDRLRKRRSAGQAHLTKGQDRASAGTIGAKSKTLG